MREADAIGKLKELMANVDASIYKEMSTDEFVVVGLSELSKLKEFITEFSADQQKDDFINNIAQTQIWDYGKKDGTDYMECDEPSDGHIDSHATLMDFVETAREIQQKSNLNEAATNHKPSNQMRP